MGTAKQVLEKAEKLGKEIILPVDIVVADAFAADANTKVVPVDEIPDGWMGLDNGPETTAVQKEALSSCKTVTKDGAVTIIGGGDSVAACEQSGRASEMSHISTG